MRETYDDEEEEESDPGAEGHNVGPVLYGCSGDGDLKRKYDGPLEHI
jgi:hypothetical protein